LRRLLKRGLDERQANDFGLFHRGVRLDPATRTRALTKVTTSENLVSIFKQDSVKSKVLFNHNSLRCQRRTNSKEKTMKLASITTLATTVLAVILAFVPG